MNKNNKIGLIVGVIIVLVAVFYGGMTYGGNNVRASISSRGSVFGQNGAGGMMRGTRNGAGGFTAGQVIAKDANSITVQLGAGGTNPQQGGASQGSGSKIIFLSGNTKITKQADGTANDLTVGTEVTVSGAANTDGSINATTIQIRPNTPPVVK
ncbi:MAG: hypothetical protein WCP17_01445 [bacterium]